ncbi:MAG: histidine phosphatase family protein [Phycisphaerales bacterium]|nr:histidine phosphatase family protein [Phycisphaerales bacterium]
MIAYLVRHAESLSNSRESPSLNAALSDLGRRQTIAVADRLAAAEISAIYASPFDRCIETAAPLAERLGLPVRIRPEICEYHQIPDGDERTHGLETVEAITRRYPIAQACPDHPDPFVWTPTQEPFESLLSRIRRFEAFLKGRWGDDDAIVVFSHGSPTARLIDAWLTMQPGPSFRFIIDNAAVSCVRFHAGVSSLICLNDVSHLAGLPAPRSGNYRDDRTIKKLPPSGYW